jgi:hypothetical protein
VISREQLELFVGKHFELVRERDTLDCDGCGVYALDEFFSVHDDVWAAGGAGRDLLCVGCLEDRLGRKLTPADFTDLPINTNPAFTRSARLRDRLGMS